MGALAGGRRVSMGAMAAGSAAARRVSTRRTSYAAETARQSATAGQAGAEG